MRPLLLGALLLVGCKTSFYSADATSSGPGPECTSGTACSDKNPCTLDECIEGICAHSPLPGAKCQTSSPCFAGTCDDAGKCQPAPAPGAACNDGDPCTGPDACNAQGICAGGTVRAGEPCSDGNACTTGDLCAANGACAPGQPAAGKACDDGDACTDGEACGATGACEGGVPVAIPDDPCRQCTCDRIFGVECVPVLSAECACNLYGKIRYVESFPDVKVKLVDGFADLEVRVVESFGADGPGEWELVDSFEDYKVQLVESFPDITVRLTDSPSGCE